MANQSSNFNVKPISDIINRITVPESPEDAALESVYLRILSGRPAFFETILSLCDKYLQRWTQLDDSLYEYNGDGQPVGRTEMSEGRKHWASSVFAAVQLRHRQLLLDLAEWKKLGGLSVDIVTELAPVISKVIDDIKQVAVAHDRVSSMIKRDILKARILKFQLFAFRMGISEPSGSNPTADCRWSLVYSDYVDAGNGLSRHCLYLAPVFEDFTMRLSGTNLFGTVNFKFQCFPVMDAPRQDFEVAIPEFNNQDQVAIYVPMWIYFGMIDRDGSRNAQGRVQAPIYKDIFKFSDSNGALRCDIDSTKVVDFSVNLTQVCTNVSIYTNAKVMSLASFEWSEIFRMNLVPRNLSSNVALVDNLNSLLDDLKAHVDLGSSDLLGDDQPKWVPSSVVSTSAAVKGYLSLIEDGSIMEEPITPLVKREELP